MEPTGKLTDTTVSLLPHFVLRGFLQLWLPIQTLAMELGETNFGLNDALASNAIQDAGMPISGFASACYRCYVAVSLIMFAVGKAFMAHAVGGRWGSGPLRAAA